MAWRRTGVRLSDLPDGAPYGATVEGRPVVLVRFGSGVHALDGACPHLGGDLAEGTVERGTITCPLHGASFDVATGAVRSDPFGVAPPEGGTGPVPTFLARVADGEVEVDLPAADPAG